MKLEPRMHGEWGEQRDRRMMKRAIALSKQSGRAGEYPYGVLICRGDVVVAESINRSKHDFDVTRHAEVVAISAVQKALNSTSLDDCVIYGSAEPCALCSYAIRESRIGRVVFGLYSPHMGGMSKWNVLGDEDISRTMPEVFAPPPAILDGFMAQEAAKALFEWNPLVWAVLKRRGLFITGKPPVLGAPQSVLPFGKRRARMWAILRRNFFDRFGRR
jgi:tRNA(adenine34) deaminase